MYLTFRLIAASAVLTAALSAPAQVSTCNIDPAHSTVEFAIKHMAISTVHGRFAVKSGVIEFDPSNPAKSSVFAVMDVVAVDTGTPQRDTHLRSADFFDTARFPTATFKSTSVKRVGDDYDVFGDLTLHGITKPVTLHFETPSKEQIGMDSKPHRGFSGVTTLHRQDFGLTWNGAVKSGDSVLGDDVKMTFDIEAGQ